MNNPTIQLNCFNSVNDTVIPLQFTHFSKCHQGVKNVAYSDLVQFNINRGAVANTIFVNPQNDGVAIATIEHGYKIVSAWIEIEHSQVTPIAILSLISTKIEMNVFANQAMYAIHQHMNSTLNGNIAVRFYIEYDKI